jgi:hypothetical protein
VRAYRSRLAGSMKHLIETLDKLQRKDNAPPDGFVKEW